MKILFIVPYPSEGQSNRFRVEQYLPGLKERGIAYSLRPFCDSRTYKILFKKGRYFRKIIFVAYFLLRRFYDVFSARSYDIVFIHREAYPFEGDVFERLFRLFGKKIVFDFDDSIFLKKPVKTERTVRLSDYVIVGNGFLRDYALKYNKNVTVLPTCIETRVYKPGNKAAAGDKVVIGWIGTSFTSIYLPILKDVYEALAARYKQLEFRIVGGCLKDFKPPFLVCKDWSLESEVGELQGFDIGVMPLFDDEMAKGKCAFKILEYMAVGIPAVASRSGMNTEVIEDGKDGFLAGSKEEWVERLSLLVEDKELREKMGKAGREKAERLYSIKANEERFIGILNKCVESAA
jgi:glycosyltransferase involved in cell wall biosynthesis